MALSSELVTLGHYLAGEFDNQAQAIAEPVWYVRLRLWQRPVPLFTEDSLVLFAEQASIVNLDMPYRPRLLRIQPSRSDASLLEVQYYMFKDLGAVRGAGRDPDRLRTLTEDEVEFLPGCLLTVRYQSVAPDRYHFSAALPADARCCFTYQNETYQVAPGFEATPDEFLSHDTGIDPQTGKAIWGALLGPYRFIKRQDFSSEFAV